jgi:hypothetical protein
MENDMSTNNAEHEQLEAIHLFFNAPLQNEAFVRDFTHRFGEHVFEAIIAFTEAAAAARRRQLGEPRNSVTSA